MSLVNRVLEKEEADYQEGLRKLEEKLERDFLRLFYPMKESGSRVLQIVRISGKD
ncbi:MAG: hypothetical protein ACLTS6_03445 [Anaerobutyricum sp.]